MRMQMLHEWWPTTLMPVRICEDSKRRIEKKEEEMGTEPEQITSIWIFLHSHAHTHTHALKKETIKKDYFLFVFSEPLFESILSIYI